MPISKFQFGTGLESEIRIGYPLFDIVTDREDGEGSSRVDLPAGGFDTWRANRMFTMDAEVRWIPDGPNTAPVQTQLSGPVSWREFLDWVRDGNAFRFVPDETVPDFFVDNTYLVEPRKGFGSLSSDIKRNVRLKLRNPTKDFHEALRGIMFEYAPGASLTDPVAATFSRATAALRRGLPTTSMAAGIGASDIAGVLRDRHYDGSRRVTLLEEARTQLVPDPDSNWGAWGTLNTPVVTAGQSDPFGGTGAVLIEDNDAGLSEGISRSVTYTGDGTKAHLVLMRPNTAGVASSFAVRDNTAVAERVQINVDWTNGVPSVATPFGTFLFSMPWGDGWYLFGVLATGVIAANSHSIHLRIGADNVADVGSAYFYLPNGWDQPYPTSPQGATLGTRNVDSLVYPLTGLRPQPMAIYLALMERGFRLGMGNGAGNTVALQISHAAGGHPRLTIEGGSNNYSVAHFPGSGGNAGASRAAGVEGDFVELLLLFRGDGSVQLIRALNGGADSVSGQSGAVQFPTSWGASPAVMLGSILGGNAGIVPLAGVKIMPLVFAGVTRDTIPKVRPA